MAPGPSADDDFIAVDVYATYPHCNGFLPDGSRMVVGDRNRPALHIVDVARGSRPDLLLELPDGDGIPWFDVALDVPRLAMAWRDQVLILDVADAAAPARTVHTAVAGGRLDGLVGISRDGATIAAIEERGDERVLLRIDVDRGAAQQLLRLPAHANHVQISAADPGWIGFAHEGPAEEVDERVWGWHADSAPEGHPLFDQRAHAATSVPLQVGHERWLFHRPGALVVAYGAGPEPSGVWEVAIDAPPRLVSPGDRDWPAGVTRDGRRVVVDTTGSADAPGRGWHDAGDRSSIVVIDARTGERTVIAETRFDRHPFHPHPSFTPDGRSVIHNHIDAAGRRGIALRDVPR